MKDPMDWFYLMAIAVVAIWVLATMWVEWGVLPVLILVSALIWAAGRIGLLRIDPLWRERKKRGR
jgi:hypothetical protein